VWFLKIIIPQKYKFCKELRISEPKARKGYSGFAFAAYLRVSLFYIKIISLLLFAGNWRKSFLNLKLPPSDDNNYYEN
jgi:hypothetical protein